MSNALVKKAHADLGASNAHRWMNCGGSLRLTRDIPQTTSVYAAEGTAAHTLVNRALTENLPASTWLGEEINGFEVNEEMAEAAQMFVDVVRVQESLDPAAIVRYEQRFSLASLNPPDDMYGTADAIVIQPTMRTLVVPDFKYGKGVFVDAHENEQLMYYGLGALLDVELDRSMRGAFDQVRLIIVQPRAFSGTEGPIREVVVSYEELVGFATTLLRLAREAMKPDAPLVPGAWCQFCRAAGVCPALKAHAVAVAQVEFEDMPAQLPPAPEKLTDAQLVMVLNKADIIEDWLKDVRAYVIAKLERGEPVPGYKLVAKKANRKWIAPDLVLEWAKANGLNPKELMTEPELESPAQVEKILKGTGIKLDATLYEKKSSGLTLAPEKDPRPAAVLGPAADFADEAPIVDIETSRIS